MLIASYAGTAEEVNAYLEGRVQTKFEVENPVLWEPMEKLQSENWIEFYDRTNQ